METAAIGHGSREQRDGEATEFANGNVSQRKRVTSVWERVPHWDRESDARTTREQYSPRERGSLRASVELDIVGCVAHIIVRSPLSGFQDWGHGVRLRRMQDLGW